MDSAAWRLASFLLGPTPEQTWSSTWTCVNIVQNTWLSWVHEGASIYINEWSLLSCHLISTLMKWAFENMCLVVFIKESSTKDFDDIYYNCLKLFFSSRDNTLSLHFSNARYRVQNFSKSQLVLHINGLQICLPYVEAVSSFHFRRYNKH